MCLAIPAKVISVDETYAKVSIGEVEYTASVLLLNDVKPGDFILLHAGFAIGKINPEEAELTLQLLREMEGESK
ncbi:MAG: HypC/HybG/HupF family hydrogenase formation chaperone [Bacteroidales bacterium]|jgi:hydrogenase expression/formation protein HypC|nr:HypC/HybG/HupF family hydrogenase formation chaperone [Bacteroidales bacterium]